MSFIISSCFILRINIAAYSAIAGFVFFFKKSIISVKDMLSILKLNQFYKMQLICDSREHKIIPMLPDWVVIDTLTVGDFAIKFEGEVKFVFERKTWKDFASSIKDGRLEEQSKNMLSLGCPVFIIFEGPAFYEQETIVAGIKFSALDAMRRKLMMLGIGQMQTKDKPGTINFLINYAQQYEKIEEKKAGIDQKLLKQKKQYNVEESVDKIWLEFPGIGKTILPIFRKIKLIDILNGNISAQQLSELKYMEKKLGKKGEKILKYDVVKILAKFPGLTYNTASYIIENYTFSEFINCGEAEMAEVYKTDSRKIGLASAKKIIEIIQYEK